MSSSSADKPFSGLVLRALATLRREHPAAHARLCEVLSGSTLLLDIDGETLALSFAHGEIQPIERAQADVTFRATRRTLLLLLDGRTSLFAAAVGGQAHIAGAPASFARFHDGLCAFLSGAARAPSFPLLLRELREQQRSEPHLPMPSRDPHV